MEYDQIFNEDCLKGLASIPDKSIDLAILDPPYYFGPDNGPGGGGCWANANTLRRLWAR